MTRYIALLPVLTFLPLHAAFAQTVSLTPTDPARWDAVVSIGWLGGNKEDLAEDWNDWYDAFATSVDVGHYWTAQLKTEIGATFTSEGSVHTYEQIMVPGQSVPVFFSREHQYALNAVRAAAVYQFFENRWVHPFVGAGVQLGWERQDIETLYPFPSGRDPRLPPTIPESEHRTEYRARPTLSGGAKFYVSERGFVRTDLSAAFDGRGASHVWWRIGGGIDF